MSYLCKAPWPKGETFVEIPFISLTPVLEAVAARMKTLFEKAFDEEGKMASGSAVLDIHGLLTFLSSLIGSLADKKCRIQDKAVHTLARSFTELRPFVEEAAK